MKLTAADPRDEPGRRKHPARAAPLIETTRIFRDSKVHAIGSATISSITSPPRANGNGGSGWTRSPTGK
jgi:hypothetical protein